MEKKRFDYSVMSKYIIYLLKTREKKTATVKF